MANRTAIDRKGTRRQRQRMQHLVAPMSNEASFVLGGNRAQLSFLTTSNTLLSPTCVASRLQRHHIASNMRLISSPELPVNYLSNIKTPTKIKSLKPSHDPYNNSKNSIVYASSEELSSKKSTDDEKFSSIATESLSLSPKSDSALSVTKTEIGRRNTNTSKNKTVLHLTPPTKARAITLDSLELKKIEAGLSKALTKAKKENDSMVFIDGPQVYACSQCRTHLTSHDDIISKSFHGRHGRAYLFDQCVNVTVGPEENRRLMTGLHVVCDIFCKRCKRMVGWTYSKAYESSQKYKEGKYIIEKINLHIEESGYYKVSHPAGERDDRWRKRSMSWGSDSPLQRKQYGRQGLDEDSVYEYKQNEEDDDDLGGPGSPSSYSDVKYKYASSVKQVCTP